MSINKCPLCQNQTTKAFSKQILSKYLADYESCINCEFLFINKPEWLEEAYKNSINDSDVGILYRNNIISKQITIFYLLMAMKNPIVDIAGGYGLLVRLLRDQGIESYWHDKHTSNIFAKNFELSNTPKKRFSILTLIEVLEHLESPVDFFQDIKLEFEHIFFTTDIKPNNNQDCLNWDYLGLDHGQHISFYSRRSLEVIARRLNLSFFSYKNMHWFSKSRITVLMKIKFFIAMNFYGIFIFIRPLFFRSLTYKDYLSISNKKK